MNRMLMAFPHRSIKAKPFEILWQSAEGNGEWPDYWLLHSAHDSMEARDSELKWLICSDRIRYKPHLNESEAARAKMAPPS